MTGAPNEPNADLWATPEEPSERIVDTYRRACAHADETITSLPLDTSGTLPFEPYVEISLHRLIVHMIGETHRHTGHADIVRELTDGAAGLRNPDDNLPPKDENWWADHRERVEQAARTATSGDRLPGR